jgi:glyoxalase-like protein
MAAPPTIPVDAERQLPLVAETFLDHVGHFIPDADAASEALTRAGFAPAPKSIQMADGQLTGTGNVTAMLERGYIEVLFKTADTPLGREFDASMARYAGLHLIAFAVADAKVASAQLAANNFRVRPIVELRRPVSTATGEATAAFTLARVEEGQMREGRIQYLTHHTEDAVWQKRWLAHPNGANALLDVVVAVADVDEAAARYVRFLGHEALPTNMGRGIFLERGGVQLVNAASLARVLPQAPAPSLPFIAGYAIRVGSLDTAERALRAGNVEAERSGRMLVAPYPSALGQGAWLFVERAGDLPWRTRS